MEFTLPYALASYGKPTIINIKSGIQLSSTFVTQDITKTYSVWTNWGDGTTIEKINLPLGITTCTINHVYTNAGNYTIRQTIMNNKNTALRDSKSITVTVV